MEFTQLFKENGIAISMDGRSCWRDNVFVERLWKSIKYEEVYLRAYETSAPPAAGQHGISTSTTAGVPTARLTA